MLAPALAQLALPLIVALSILLMLIRPRGIAEVYWISGGVLFLLALQLIPPALAGRAIMQGADVYLFLIGMMLLSELARAHGVFEWVSSITVRHARGSGTRLFTLIYGVGTVVTIFMSNDATAVVLTPAILAAVRHARAQPLPHLFACALIANAASFVLPISNPANLVVFQSRLPPLGSWIAAFALPSLLAIGATYFVLRFLFRQELRAAIAIPAGKISLTVHGRLVLGGLALMIGALLTASALDWKLGLPTCLVALVITALVSLRARTNPLRLVREISWSTLLLVAGLFILVAALERQGALAITQSWLRWAQTLPQYADALVVGFAVGFANNVVNNLPLGLIAGATLQAAPTTALITNATLIGVDLGPNLSITGSLATILWLIALRKEKIEVGFTRFLKVGAVAMPIALCAALGGLFLQHWLSMR